MILTSAAMPAARLGRSRCDRTTRESAASRARAMRPARRVTRRPAFRMLAEQKEQGQGDFGRQGRRPARQAGVGVCVVVGWRGTGRRLPRDPGEAGSGAGRWPRPRVMLASVEPRRVLRRSRTRGPASGPGQSRVEARAVPERMSERPATSWKGLVPTRCATTGCPMMRILRWLLPLSGVAGRCQGSSSTPRGVQLRSPGVSTRLAKHAGPPPAWTSLIFSLSQGTQSVNGSCCTYCGRPGDGRELAGRPRAHHPR
jgi:hypothetical protein